MDALNEILKFASGDPVVGISQNIKYKRANQKGLKVMFSKDCLFEEMKNVNKLNSQN